MDEKRNLFRNYSAGLVFLVFTINYLAIFFHWYYTFFWLDKMVHFLGGLALSFIVLWLFYNFLSSLPRFYIFIIVILSVLSVGLLWEIYEFAVKGYLGSSGVIYFADSILDLVFDVSGAFLGFLLFKNRLALIK